jgi:lipopolysaccharide biosynthesis glycosyltransferase
MKVAFTTVLDDKYLPGFLITVNSILRTSKNFNYDIVILDWGDLSNESKQVMRSLYDRIIFKPVDKQLYATHVYDETYRIWTYNCNYRFDIFTSTDYDRVVFFDCDMIFQIDVEELLSWDVDFGACAAQSGAVAQINRSIGFDGGLMSVGKRFLNEETRSELLQIASSSAPLDEHILTTNWVSDEPILNTYFLDKMVWLPEKFNLVVAKLNEELINTPNNYQFAGHNKPWYGSTIDKQFSAHALESIRENTNSSIKTNFIAKKLLRLFDSEVVDLLKKQIDIYKFTGMIQSSTYE